MLKGKVSLLVLIIVSTLFVVGLTRFTSKISAAGELGSFIIQLTATTNEDGEFWYAPIDLASACFRDNGSQVDISEAQPDPFINSVDYFVPWTTPYSSGNPPPINCQGSNSNGSGIFQNVGCAFDCVSVSNPGQLGDLGDVCSNELSCKQGLKCTRSGTQQICLRENLPQNSSCISSIECQRGLSCLSNSSGSLVCRTTDSPTTPTTPPDTIAGQGGSCIPNYLTCDTNQRNFLEAFNSGAIRKNSGLINNSTAIYGLNGSFGTVNVNKVCISSDVDNLIPVIVQNPTPLSEFRDPLEIQLPNSDSQKYIYMRACAPGYSPSSFTPPAAFNRLGSIWGCCPNNMIYVGPNNSSSDYQAQQAGVCCPTSATHTAFSDNGVQKCFNAAGELPGVIAIDDEDDPLILGVKLGRDSGKAKVSNDKGALKKCSQDSVCAIVPGNGGINLDGSNSLVNPEAFTSNSDLQCTRCYVQGEAIAIVDSNGTQKLAICDASAMAANRLDLHDLVNNSVADTLAVIRAQDQANKDLIATCRAGGGIPTALGCLDPSPLGIITGLIRIALGVIGGVALLQLILVGLQYQRGNEEEIKKARDRLIATLSGVAVLIFSVLILRILGVNILDLIPAGSI